MLLSAVSVLVVAQSSLEVPEGLMNNPAHTWLENCARRVYTLLQNSAVLICFVTETRNRAHN